MINEYTDIENKNIDETQRKVFYYSESIEELQKEMTRANKDMREGYMELQNQALTSLQSTFATILENTSTIITNNQIYCSKLPQIYSKMITIYTENAIAVSKMINDIAFANANSVKKLYDNS